jgi:methylated-DNA-protein-cysteine methyltransferase-like protein
MKSIPPYFELVYDMVRSIPMGKVSTYGIIADCLALGSARMVGWALHQSFDQIPEVPAHRVVNRKGELSGRMHFNPPELMQALLESEGLLIENHIVIDLENHLYIPRL